MRELDASIHSESRGYGKRVIVPQLLEPDFAKSRTNVDVSGGMRLARVAGMHHDEFDELTECAVCHAEISPAGDRAFAYAPGAYLCWECALARGGVYDADEDRWTELPNVAGLEDERRPHEAIV